MENIILDDDNQQLLQNLESNVARAMSRSGGSVNCNETKIEVLDLMDNIYYTACVDAHCMERLSALLNIDIDSLFEQPPVLRSNNKKKIYLGVIGSAGTCLDRTVLSSVAVENKDFQKPPTPNVFFDWVGHNNSKKKKKRRGKRKNWDNTIGKRKK